MASNRITSLKDIVGDQNAGSVSSANFNSLDDIVGDLTGVPNLAPYETPDDQSRLTRIGELRKERSAIESSWHILSDQENLRLEEINTELTKLSIPNTITKEQSEMVMDEMYGIDETFNPLEAFLTIGGSQAYNALKFAGATLKGAIARGSISGTVGGTTAIPIDVVAQEISEDNPWLGLGFALGTSLAVGGFVDLAIEERTLKALNHFAPRFFSKNLGKIVTSNTKNVSDLIKARLQVLADRMDKGDIVAIREAQELLRREAFQGIKDKINPVLVKQEREKSLTRRQVNRAVLKKSFAELDDKDLQDIQDLAEVQSFKRFTQEFDTLKNKINTRLAVEAYQNHPILDIVTDINRSGGFKESTIRHMIGDAATEDLKKRFPNLVRPNGTVSPIKKAVANDYESVEEMLLDLAQMPTLKRIKAGVNRDTQAEWDLLYLDEAMVRLGGTELKMWERIGGKKLVNKVRRQARKETEGYVAARTKTLNDIFTETNFIRRVGLRTTKAFGRVVKAQERLTQLARAEVFKQAAKDKREILSINGRFKNAIRNGSVPYEYQAQINAYLSPYAKTTPLSEPLNMSLRDFIQTKVDQDVPLAKLVREQFEDIFELPQITRSQGDLTLDQYRKIDALLQNIQRMGKAEKFADLITGRQYVNEIANEINETASKTFQRVKEIPTQRQFLAQAPSRIRKSKEATSDKLAEWMSELKRPEFILRELDGWEEFGPAQRLFSTAKKAEDAEFQIMKVIQKRWGANIKRYAKNIGRKRLTAKFWNQMFEDSRGFFQTTREKMLTIAAMTGNPYNKQAMLKSIGVDEIVINRFLRENMTDVDWRLVKDTWKMTDEMYDMLAETYKKMTGMPLPKVKNYFPIIPDYKHSGRNVKESLEDVFLDTPHLKKIPPGLSKRFFKPRTGKSDAIRMDFDALAKHLRDVSHTVSHWGPTTDIKKVIHSPIFKDAVVSNLGEQKYHALTTWADDLIKPAPTDASFLKKIRANVTVANLGLKLTTALVQPLSLVSAIPKVGAKNIIEAMTRMVYSPREMYKAINEVSSQMATRDKAWQRDIGELLDMSQMKKFKKVGSVDRNFFFKLIRAGDIIGSYTTWYAGWLKGMKQFDGDADKAIRFADGAVRQTQPQSSLKDLPKIMRDNKEWKRALTMFYSYYSVLHNQAAEMIMRGRVGNMSIGQVMESLGWMYLVPPVISSIIRDKSIHPEDLVKNTFSHVSGGLPIVRDITASLAMGYDYTISPMVELPKSVIRLGDSAIEFAQGEWEPSISDAYDASKFIGYSVGLPTGQMMTLVRGASSYINDELIYDDNPFLIAHDILVRQKRERD